MASCRVQGTRLYTRRQTPALRGQPFMAGSFRSRERQPPALRENVRHCRPDRPHTSDSLRKNPAPGTQEQLRLSDGLPAPFVRCFSDAKAAGAYGTAGGALQLSAMEREVSRSVPARPGCSRHNAAVPHPAHPGQARRPALTCQNTRFRKVDGGTGGKAESPFDEKGFRLPPGKDAPRSLPAGGSEEGIGQLFSSLRALTLCQNGVVSSLVTAK